MTLETLLVELENDIVRSTEFHAAAHGVSHERGEIASLALQALRNPAREGGTGITASVGGNSGRSRDRYQGWSRGNRGHPRLALPGSRMVTWSLWITSLTTFLMTTPYRPR